MKYFTSKLAGGIILIKFEDYQYTKPNMAEVKQDFDALLQEFRSASSYDQQNEVIEKINTIGKDYSTHGQSRIYSCIN